MPSKLACLLNRKPTRVFENGRLNGWIRVAEAEIKIDHQSLPPLMRDRSFWGINVTQFFGAFNDNLFKQLMLLLAVPMGAAAAAGGEDQQDLATVIFSLPFVLFSGYAGYISDRYSKRTIIVCAKFAEILVMGLGMVAFAMYTRTGYVGLLVVLLLMGTQSTFFGPGKYGILPQMLRDTDLPRANGLIMMSTFLAIIFGTASAGALGDWLVDPQQPLEASAGNLWKASAMCVLIAVVGTCTSLLVRRVPPSKPDLRVRGANLFVPTETVRMTWGDRRLLAAILATCVFWMVGSLAMQTVNSVGLVQLGLNKLQTSILVATIGLGIAVGAVLAGRLSHGKADFRIVRVGVWGITSCLILLSITENQGQHLLGFQGALPVLVLLGISAGMFAIPIQVFVQSRPPAEHKGRMIAVMNQANFIAILFSGIVYGVFDELVQSMNGARSWIFAFIAVLMLPVILFYRGEGVATDGE